MKTKTFFQIHSSFSEWKPMNDRDREWILCYEKDVQANKK